MRRIVLSCVALRGCFKLFSFEEISIELFSFEKMSIELFSMRRIVLSF